MHKPRLQTLLPIILLEIYAVIIVICLLKIPAYPLMHDIPNIHFIAQRILAGAVPYRDIIDMNMPGIYLIHLVVVLIPGNPNIVWFCFHLCWALLTATAAYKLLSPESKPAAWMAAVSFLAFYATRKAFYYGQRDFFLLLPVLLGLIAFLQYLQSDRHRHLNLFLSGPAFGLAATIKPLPFFFTGFCGIWLLFDKQSPLKLRVIRATILAAGSLLPYAGILIWLAIAGGLPSFIRLALNLSPVYFLWQHLNPGEMLFFTTIESRILACMLVAALGIGVVMRQKFSGSPRVIILAAGVVYGLIHYFSQAKGWEYHQIPFILFAILLTSLLLTGISGSGKRGWAIAASLCLFLPLAAYVPKGAWIMVHDPAGYLDTFQPAVHKLESDYTRLGLADQSIQILDMTTGSTYLMYAHHRAIATPYLLDFALEASENQAYLGFRTDFMDRVTANPPDVFIVAREFPSDTPLSYARFSDWVEFLDWFEANYTLVSDQTEYQIFERK